MFQDKFTAKAVRDYDETVTKYRGYVQSMMLFPLPLTLHTFSIMLHMLADTPENYNNIILHFSTGIILDVRKASLSTL